MVQGMLTNLEISFWKAAIPLMRESMLLQVTLRKVIPLIQNRDFLRLLAQVTAFASAGLVIGFAIGAIKVLASL
jgi:hypothetical protein